MGALRGLPLLFFLAVSAVAEPFPLEQFSAFRRGLGLEVTAWSSTLAASAAARAEVLAAEGVLSHEDRNGRGPGLQMMAEGFRAGEFGEVLAAGLDSEKVWQAWLSSPSHRAVLAEPGWSLWGAGQASVSGSTVWVVRFWRP